MSHQPHTFELRISHSRLAVYRHAVAHRAMVARIACRRGTRELRDQLSRAASSIVLNIAEGAGRDGRADKRRFYLIARGSTHECSAIFDLLLVTDVVDQREYEKAQTLLVQIVRLLTTMARNLEG